MSTTQHIISVGGGLSSTMALPHHVVERYGRDRVRLVMARLPNEDPDVWRLCDAVAADLNMSVEYIGLGLSPWDVFWQEGMIGNSRVDPCSRRLKREVLRDWMAANCDPTSTVLHVGITYDEIDRMVALAANWSRMGWKVQAPLAADRSTTRERLIAQCQARYGFVPRLYSWGFTHNNCGGACIKAGQLEWARTWWYLTDVYAWWEGEETRFRAAHGKDVAILRDRRGSKTKPLPLAVFRRWLEIHRQSRLPGLEFEDFVMTLPRSLDPTPACAWCAAA